MGRRGKELHTRDRQRFMERRNREKDRIGRKKRSWGLPSVWEGLLMVTVAVLVVFFYHWFHRGRDVEIPVEAPEVEMAQEKTLPEPEPPPPVAMESSPREGAETGGTIEFLYMKHRSGDGGGEDGGESPATALTDRGDVQHRQRSDRDVRGGIGTNGETGGVPEGPEYSDAEAPSVLSIVIDPQKVPPDSEVQIQVRARDNLSGVRSISGSVQSPSGKARLSFGFRPSEDGSHFIATFKVPDRAEMGSWSVSSLHIRDNVHNARRYTAKDAPLSSATFQVVESDSDGQPPEVVAFKVEPSEAYGGETVQIRVTVRDNKSGVSRVYGAFTSPSGNARLSFTCRDKTGPETVSGSITLPGDVESGDWVLHYVRAEDEAKNGKSFFRNDSPDLFEDAVIRVYTAGSDGEPPSLDYLSISPREVSYNDTLTIAVSASDDISGIGHVMGRVRSPSGQAAIPFTCAYDSFDDVYRAELNIKNNSEVGEWRVEYVRLMDKARNQATFRYETNPYVAEAVFEVTGE